MAIAEPWEDNTRSFADGDIRHCDLVSKGALGFVSMTLDGLVARYDPTRGLVLGVPTTFYNPSEGVLEEGQLEVVLNRKTLGVTASRM